MTSCLCKQSLVFSIDLAGLATCEAGAGSVGGEGDPRVGVVVHTRPAAAHWTPGPRAPHLRSPVAGGAVGEDGAEAARDEVAVAVAVDGVGAGGGVVVPAQVVRQLVPEGVVSCSGGSVTAHAQCSDPPSAQLFLLMERVSLARTLWMYATPHAANLSANRCAASAELRSVTTEPWRGDT